MNLTHLHLALNHVPVLGTAFALALLVLGIWRKSNEVKKTALCAFVAIAIMAMPAYLTGEPAEDGVEGPPGVSGAIIEQHEEAEGVAFAGMEHSASPRCSVCSRCDTEKLSPPGSQALWSSLHSP
jgi:hypothetical protein